MFRHAVTCTQGSPPHGRGKGQNSPILTFNTRITPAWAGKSRRRHSSMPKSQDHPRMGGEKACCGSSLCRLLGSPPHGRGKDFNSAYAVPLHGITPAWAGKSQCSGTPSPARRDHPRMGGEKRTAGRQSVQSWGSPPHGRGKESVPFGKNRRIRITPAWAGKRYPHYKSTASSQDHPRMGGEKR